MTGEPIELLPCPFCGGGDAFVEQSTFASSYAICNDCMARGPDATQEGDDEAEPGRDAAIAAWNTRLSAAKPEWRDIASAPKDGTRFLAYEDGNHYALEWKQEMPGPNGGYWTCRCGQYVTMTPEPTHWQPLPSAPGTPPTSEREGNWVLVPREPTEAMLEAGVPFSVNLAWVTELWSAMLAASPNQETQRG